MAALDEAIVQQTTQVHASLDDGKDQVSNFQVVLFRKYVRMVLPADGFVFWVRADLLCAQMLFSAYRFNASALGQVRDAVDSPNEFEARVDVHYSAQNTQDEAEANVNNRVLVASAEELVDLQDVGPYVIYVGEIDDVRYAFSAHGYLQENAGMWHYSGLAVLASMEEQLVDRVDQLDSESLVASNSLPFWVSLNNHVPEPYENFGNDVPVYPSYLLPSNLPPPYVTAHVEPNATRALASAPSLSPSLSHEQLARDVVRLTFYGLRNDQAQDFVDLVLEQSEVNGVVGIMNMPVLADEKRFQVELGALAVKKTAEFEVSYLQSRVRDVARKKITDAFVADFRVDDSTPPAAA